MTYTKTCTFLSCREQFAKPDDMPLKKWNRLERCPSCRKKAHRPRPIGSFQPETNLGRYEVKSEIIDRFLYG